MRRYEKGDGYCALIMIAGIILFTILYSKIDINKRKRIEKLSKKISELRYSSVLYYISFTVVVVIYVTGRIVTGNKYIMAAVSSLLVGCLMPLFDETIEKDKRKAAEKKKKQEKGNHRTQRIKGKAAASKRNHSKRNKR